MDAELIDGELPSAESLRPRKPWLAFLLGLLAPGLGHLYAGAVLRGIIAMATFYLIVLPGTVLLRLPLASSRSGAIACMILLLVVLLIPLDGALAARSRRLEPLKRYNRLWVYVVYAIAAIWIYDLPAKWWVEQQWVQTFNIPSGAMENTLLIGDRIIADMREGKLFPVRRGEIVVFRKPMEPEVLFIKRVVGLPGETVELREGILHVDGRALAESYISPQHRERDPRRNFGPFSVQPEHYFLLGDHRGQSQDSRFWGTVPESYLEGRAVSIWWSRPAGYLTSVRHERMGRPLELPEY